MRLSEKQRKAFLEGEGYFEAIHEAGERLQKYGDCETYIAFDLDKLKFVMVTSKPYYEDGLLHLQDLSNMVSDCPYSFTEDFTIYDYVTDSEFYPDFESYLDDHISALSYDEEFEVEDEEY